MGYPIISISSSVPGNSDVTLTTQSWSEATSQMQTHEGKIAAYNAAAAASYSAGAAALSATAYDWTSTGNTYSGNAAPATPGDIVSTVTGTGACGAGANSRYVTAPVIGPVISTTAFYSAVPTATATESFRWVNTQPYIAPGAYVPTNETPAIGYFINSQMYTACAALSAPDASTLADAMLAACNGLGVGIIGGAIPGYYMRTAGAVWAMQYYYVGPGYNTRAVGVVGSQISAGQTGVWRKDHKLTLTAPVSQTDPSACAYAYYMESTDPNWDPVESPRAYKMKLALWLPTAPHSGAGLAYVGSLTNPFASKVANVFDPNAPTVPGYTKTGSSQPVGLLDATFPGTSFNLQSGSVIPPYPTFKSMYVYDILLKKWGRQVGDFKELVDFNSVSSVDPGLAYTDFGMSAGVITAAGAIKLFASVNINSWIRFGKIGFYRLGMTQINEVKAQFRPAFNGSLTLESSFDGQGFDAGRTYSQSFVYALNATLYPDISARWHTIKITGNFDLTSLEFRGRISGRR